MSADAAEIDRGTCGTARCRSSARPPLTPKWRCSPGRIPRATRRLRGGRRGPRSSGSPLPISTCSAGIVDVTEIAFRPNLATDDAETGRQASHAAARNAAKIF